SHLHDVVVLADRFSHVLIEVAAEDFGTELPSVPVDDQNGADWFRSQLSDCPLLVVRTHQSRPKNLMSQRHTSLAQKGQVASLRKNRDRIAGSRVIAQEIQRLLIRGVMSTNYSKTAARRLDQITISGPVANCRVGGPDQQSERNETARYRLRVSGGLFVRRPSRDGAW